MMYFPRNASYHGPLDGTICVTRIGYGCCHYFCGSASSSSCCCQVVAEGESEVEVGGVAAGPAPAVAFVCVEVWCGWL